MNRPTVTLASPGPVDFVALGRRRPRTTFILVPGPFGALHLFERRGSAAPRSRLVLTDAEQLRRVLKAALPLGPLVTCGSRHLEPVVHAAADLTDVYLVPLHWLRSTRDDLQHVATLASRLVNAHRHRPIEIIYRLEQYGFPF